MMEAWKRVKSNGGSAGVDGLTITETKDYLKDHWPRIRAGLLDGSSRPRPVRRVEIPKPDGGVRQLGIPTVTDRLIQQALLQVLQPLIDPSFSEHSYGFRPGRRAHDAVRAAQRYLAQRHLTDCPVRFDVVAIDNQLGQPPVVRLHKDAFSPQM